MSEHYETSWFCDKLCSHRRNIDSALIAANATIDDLSGQLLALQDELKVWKTRDVVRLLNENEKLKSSLVELNNKLEIEASQLNGNPYAPPMKVYKENE